MLKEKIKNIVLTILVISSIVLTGNMWFNERLWPDGYNLFARSGINIKEIIAKISGVFGKQNTTLIRAGDTLYVPNNIIINENNELLYYGAGKQGFEEIFDKLKPIIKDFFLSADTKNVRTADISEWQQALSADSVYINYRNSFDTKILGLIFDVNDTRVAEQISQIKEFILIPGDSMLLQYVDQSIVVMARDSKTNQIYQYNIGTDKKILDGIIDKYVKDPSFRTYQYAFVLELDKGSDGGGFEMKFDPMLVYEFVPSKSVLIGNQKTEPIINNPAEKEKVLRLFGLTPGTLGEYSESDGSVVCVETFATVRFNADNSIEYTAAPGYDGLNLLGDGMLSSSYVDNINYATKFLESTRGELHDKGNIRLTSNLSQAPGGKIDMTFDYYFDGKPVILTGMDDKIVGNAIRMTVENGYLKYYKHYLKYYEETEQRVENTDMLDAVNEIIDSLPENSDIYIEDMFLAYADDGKSVEIQPKWYAKIRGIEGFVTR